MQSLNKIAIISLERLNCRILIGFHNSLILFLRRRRFMIILSSSYSAILLNCMRAKIKWRHVQFWRSLGWSIWRHFLWRTKIVASSTTRVSASFDLRWRTGTFRSETRRGKTTDSTGAPSTPSRWKAKPFNSTSKVRFLLLIRANLISLRPLLAPVRARNPYNR